MPSPDVPAPTGPSLHWTGWDTVARCGGVDVSLALAGVEDGNQQVRMQFVNHTAFPAVVAFRTVFLGSSGQDQPSPGEISVKLNANSTSQPMLGDLVPFTIAQYGLKDMTVQVQGMSLPCPVRPKRAPATRGGNE